MDANNTQVGLKAAGSTPKSIMSDLLSQRDKGKEAFAERAVEEIALTVFVEFFHFQLLHTGDGFTS